MTPAPIAPPSRAAYEAARARLAGLAQPTGALGRLEDVAAWLAACQDACPPRPLQSVRAVVLAGDHGVAGHGVSAYPRDVTAAMVRTMQAGRAGVSVLARANGSDVEVLDIAVDADFPDLPPDVGRHKIRRSSGAIHREDALTPAETTRALEAGDAIAADLDRDGTDLLIVGDLGIGNTTPGAALIAGVLGLPAEEVTGRGTGVDDAGLDRKRAVVARALSRAGSRASDPVDRLTALASADIAVGVALMIGAARRGIPVLLDGLVAVAEALAADDLAPGAAAWFAAGHRSTEPAQSLALEKLGLVPMLDLGLRLGEGSGAVAAVPLVRAAGRLLAEMALLSDLG